MTTASTGVPLRRAFGAVRIAAGLLVLAAVLTQIIDPLLHDAFRPGEFFAYFTIESSLMNVVVLLVGGVMALRRPVDTRLFTNVRVAMLAYAVVTGLVYNALLRNLPPHGYQGIHWPTEVMHVVIPIVIVVDWVLAPGRLPVRWKALWLVASYPLAWIAFTMLRGAVTGWYPYPFLEPSQPGGYLSVLVYVVLIAAVIIGFASIGIAVSRVGRAGRLAPSV